MDHMPERILRLGVIGLGRAAAQMLPSLAAHPNVRVTAAADPNPDALARFATDFGGRTYADANALCADPAIDGVYIASPHQYHVGHALAAANAGKHLIVEKPMALSLEECHAMTDAAERNGVVLIVGHSHGFDPAPMLMRAIVQRGDYGRLRMMTNLNYNNFLYRPRRPEELDTAQGGGIIYNQIPHMIDVLRTVHGGPIASVHAVSGCWDPKRPTEGALAALVQFADGVPATLTYSGYDRFDSDEFYGWVGEGGEEKQPDYGASRRAIDALASQRDEIELRAKRGFAGTGATRANGPMHQPHFGFFLASLEGADLRPSPDGILIYDAGGVHELRAPAPRAFPNKDGVIDEFYDAIASGTPPLHDGAWGTATMAATLAILQSSRDAHPTTIEETTHAAFARR
jgi:phthalate 4,5-cis-dihydrodiol dehydrogenase